MNPRVSRSSALASKATGFPIAKIAAKLALGYHLDEIPNDITRVTPASFEPTIDYVVVKIPRWNFEKFPQADRTLTTQMKSVGEAMAIGRTFKEAFMKGVRSLELGRSGLLFAPSRARRGRRCGAAEAAGGADRSAHVGSVPRAQPRLERRADSRDHEDRSVVPAAVRGDPRAAPRGRRAGPRRRSTRRPTAPAEARRVRRRRARAGDRRDGDGGPDDAARRTGSKPVYKRVDTCAAEFESFTPYLYSSYEPTLRGESEQPRQGRDPRQRAEPDRPGHRVRLLLLPRRLRAARGRASRR